MNKLVFTLLSITIFFAIAKSGLVPFYRYVNSVEHFYTCNSQEIGTTTVGATGNYGYKYEGIAGYLYDQPVPGSVPFYRYFNGKDHFYTTHPEEIGTTTPGTTGNYGYVCEGISGYLFNDQVQGTVPYYRYCNGVEHFYTSSAQEIGTTTVGATGNYGYKYEGNYFIVSDPNAVPAPVNPCDCYQDSINKCGDHSVENIPCRQQSAQDCNARCPSTSCDCPNLAIQLCGTVVTFIGGTCRDVVQAACTTRCAPPPPPPPPPAPPAPAVNPCDCYQDSINKCGDHSVENIPCRQQSAQDCNARCPSTSCDCPNLAIQLCGTVVTFIGGTCRDIVQASCTKKCSRAPDGQKDHRTWLMSDYDCDLVPDLVYVKNFKTLSGNVEVHIASAASNFQTRLYESSTTFANEDDGVWTMAKYDADSVPDFIFIKTSNTPSGNVEVHVASSASKYQTRVFESGTTFANENDGVWTMADYDKDGVADLIFIKTANTPGGNIEVHVSSAASNYQTRIFESGTTFGCETDGVWTMANYDADGIPDLIFIKTANTPSGNVEVHVASGSSNYQTRVFESATTFANENDGVWTMSDFDKDGVADLIFIKTYNTPTIYVEVHVASAASNYQTRILETATTFLKHK